MTKTDDAAPISDEVLAEIEAAMIAGEAIRRGHPIPQIAKTETYNPSYAEVRALIARLRAAEAERDRAWASQQKECDENDALNEANAQLVERARDARAKLRTVDARLSDDAFPAESSTLQPGRYWVIEKCSTDHRDWEEAEWTGSAWRGEPFGRRPDGSFWHNHPAAIAESWIIGPSAAEPRQQWRPISEAPRNGTNVWLTGYMYGDPAKGRWQVTGYFSGINCWIDTNTGDPLNDPTHWMPEPPPPDSEEEKPG